MNGTVDTARVTELLARQSQAIDDGDAIGFAATYTPDGSFSSVSYGDPVVGTAALERFAREVHASLVAEGIQQRHWINNIVVDSEALTARSYLMIVRTDADGVTTILRHVTTTDQLAIDESGELKVHSRQVHRES